MEKANKNFLILGHTGVGKSSLINYLVNKDVVATSTGKPCTPKDTWQTAVIPSPFADNETLTMFDSWGLEANRSKEWKELVLGKLQDNWNEKIICGIIYCFSYFHRIEDFELDLIKDVLTTGYNVLIVLTNADCADHEAKKEAYYFRINEALTDFTGKYKIVEVCNVSFRKLVGEAKKFGREEMLQTLAEFSTENLYRLYCSNLDKIAGEVLKKIQDRLESFRVPVAKDKVHPIFVVIGIVGYPVIGPLAGLGTIAEYNKTQEIFKKDIRDLRTEIATSLEKFGEVFRKVYNVSFKTKPLSFWEKLKSFLGAGTNIDDKHLPDLQQQYMDSLLQLKQIVSNNIEELKHHKEKVYFVDGSQKTN